MALITQTAQAQALVQCVAHKTALAFFEEKAKQIPVALGLSNENAVIEVLATEKGEKWTMIITTDGITCFVSAGENWRTMKQVPLDPEA